MINALIGVLVRRPYPEEVVRRGRGTKTKKALVVALLFGMNQALEFKPPLCIVSGASAGSII